MSDSYSFQVQAENLKKNISKMNAMHIMAAILLLVFCIMTIPYFNQVSLLVGGAVLTLFIIVGLVFFKNKKLQLVPVNVGLRLLEAILFGAIAFRFYEKQSLLFLVLYLVASFFMLVLLVVEYRLFKKSFVLFSTKGVVFSTFIQNKRFEWAKLNNVLVKHDLLTLHLKGDTFIQQSVTHNYTPAELNSFQDFLNKHIT